MHDGGWGFVFLRADKHATKKTHHQDSRFWASLGSYFFDDCRIPEKRHGKRAAHSEPMLAMVSLSMNVGKAFSMKVRKKNMPR